MSDKLRATILVVDDDLVVADVLKEALKSANYQVKHVKDANSAYVLLEKGGIDLVILDYNLPGISGMKFLEMVRNEPKIAGVPVLMLTVRNETQLKVKGLETGADDYVVKPAAAGELLARVNALLRRSRRETPMSDVLEHGPLAVDINRRRAWASGQEVDLTPTEFLILAALLRRPEGVHSFDALAQLLGEQERLMTSETLYAHVSSLRKKLGRAGDVIESVRGIGYRLR